MNPTSHDPISRRGDVLDLLMPEADAVDRGRALRWTRFLRLVANDAQASRSQSVRVNPHSASEEFELSATRRLLGALESIMGHQLTYLQGMDTFASCGDPEWSHQAAWSIVEGLRADRAQLPELSAPGEPPLELVERVLDAAEAHGLGPDRCCLWRSRIARLQGRSPAALGPAAAHRTVVARLADDAAAEMDRGRLRQAMRLLEGRPLPPESHAQRLLDWCRQLIPDEARPQAEGGPGPVLVVPAATAPGGLPAPLIELRKAWPALAPGLPGGRRRKRAQQPSLEHLPGRLEVGASVWMRFAFDGSGVEVLGSELAPALEGKLEAWLLQRDGSWRDSQAAENELVLCARPIQRRSLCSGRAPHGALDPATRSMALVPILGPRGEVRGWLHAEFDHHLLPSRECLAEWGRCANRGWDVEPVVSDRSTCAKPGTRSSQLFLEALAEVKTKTRHRRWWGFLQEFGGPVPAAEGGAGLAGSPIGEGLGLQRCLQTQSSVAFDSPSPNLSQAADAASGAVLPVLLAGRVVGQLAIESERRRDFRTRDLERLRGALEARAVALRHVSFDAWNRGHGGRPVPLAPGVAGVRRTVSMVLTAARRRAPLFLTGPLGTGKRNLARWYHFERGQELPRDTPAPRLVGPDAACLADDLSRAGPLILDQLERWSEGAQRLLVRALLEGSLGPVAIVVDRSDACSAPLDPALEHLLIGDCVGLRPLSERRQELPELMRSILDCTARRHGVARLELGDDSLALLWRQPWEGNLQGLERALSKLLLNACQTELDAGDTRELLEEQGLRVLAKLPSRHPGRGDVEAALEVTRKENGRWNKSRAALYLGWDPDTLVARMGDLSLGA